MHPIPDILALVEPSDVAIDMTAHAANPDRPILMHATLKILNPDCERQQIDLCYILDQPCTSGSRGCLKKSNAVIDPGQSPIEVFLCATAHVAAQVGAKTLAVPRLAKAGFGWTGLRLVALEATAPRHWTAVRPQALRLAHNVIVFLFVLRHLVSVVLQHTDDQSIV